MAPLLNEYQEHLKSTALTARLIDLKALEAQFLMPTFVRFVASALSLTTKDARLLIVLSMYAPHEHFIDQLLFEFRSYKRPHNV